MNASTSSLQKCSAEIPQNQFNAKTKNIDIFFIVINNSILTEMENDSLSRDRLKRIKKNVEILLVHTTIVLEVNVELRF